MPQPQPFRPLIPKTLLKTFSVFAIAAVLSPLMLASSATSAITPDPNMVRITADKQSYNPDNKKYLLNGRVAVSYQDIRITGNKAEVETDAAGKPQVAHFFERPMFKRVKPQVGEDNIVGDVISVYLVDDRFGAQGHVISHIATVAADPFLIRSDVQEFDHKNKVMAASGNVQVDYQGSQASSSLANVRMKENGKAERVIFSGGARIKKKNSEINGDRVTVMVDSGNLLAEHNVKTRVDLQSQPNNPANIVITSDYQQYDKASDLMIASGNVKIIYGDYIAVGPKATFRLKDQDVDQIFLTGRPTITEPGRTITADKITISTHPKNFDAVGNVKVNFQAHQKPGASAAPATTAGKKPTITGKPAVKGGKPLPTDDPSDY